MNLAFGLSHAIPETVTAAWGCRAIVKQTGEIDVLHDRQDLQGPPEARIALRDWLNHGPFVEFRLNAAKLLRDYKMRTREAEQFTLFEDDRGIIVGNTNGSAGYLYVAAWLKEERPACGLPACHDAPAPARVRKAKRRWWVKRTVVVDGNPVITNWSGLLKREALEVYAIEAARVTAPDTVEWGE